MSPHAAPWLPDQTKSFHNFLASHLTAAATATHQQPQQQQQAILQIPTDQASLKYLKKSLAALRLDFVTLFRPQQSQYPSQQPQQQQQRSQSNADRQDTLLGKVTINGKKQQANANFAQSVVFLSDMLNITEARAAAIFQNACDLRSRYQGWSKIKIAVHLFHRDRDYLLESLVLMVTRIIPGKAADDFVKIIDSFLGELLLLPVSFPQKIMESMKYLKDVLDAFVKDPSMGGAITAEQAHKLDVEEDVITVHADQLAKERNRLGDLLYYTTCRWRLTSAEMVKLIGNLRSVAIVDVATVSMLCSLLMNLDHLQTSPNTPRLSLKASDFETLKREITGTEWNVSGLRAVAWTQWVVFLHYCVSDVVDQRIHDDTFHALVLADYDDASRRWRDSVGRQPEVYAFIGDHIIPFRKTKQEVVVSPLKSTEAIELEVRDAYVGQVERLVDGLIVFLRWALKDIKCRDEDATRALDQAERKAAANSINGRSFVPAELPILRQQTAWEALLFLITILYRDRPDAAVSFWADPSQVDMDEHDGAVLQTPEKQAFVRMAADVRTSRFLRAFINMLASLATGTFSAHQVHIKLNADPSDSQLGSVLWTTFFTSLNSAIDILGRENRDLPPHEIDSMISFLRLLRQVVKFSYSARRTLCDNQHLRAIHTLFWLLGSRVPVHLKAALLEAIAAFCIPLGNSYDIQLQVWAMLEQSQIVPTMTNARGPRDERGILHGSQQGLQTMREGHEGIIYDLEEIESQNGTYPETLALLRLLDVLLHGHRNVQMASVFQTLGMPDRVPGIRPYVRFVADHVFCKSFIRRFDDPEERWEIISSCLSIFDKCLDLFDLGALVSEGSADENGDAAQYEGMSLGAGGFGPQILHNAQILGLHPAFEITCGLLGKTKLTERMFDVIAVGVDMVNESAERVSLCGKSVSLALHIILRVLQCQKAFLEILAPALLEVGAAEWIGLPSAMGGIDHLLSFRNAVVINIAEYVMCVDDEVCLVAVSILSILSQSAVYGAIDPVARMNRLLTLFQSSPSADAIIAGFVKRLEMEEDEGDHIPTSLDEGADPSDVIARAEMDAAQELEALVAENWQARPWPNPKAGLVHAVRIAILNLLLLNVSNAASPTVGHFLLGHDMRQAAIRSNAGTQAPDAAYNCLHAIIGLIRVRGETGGKAVIGDSAEAEELRSEPLFRTHPRLAERCYRLIYQLCVDTCMSASTMLYLRNQEDFFYEQLRMMPVGKTEEVEESDGAISAILARLLQRTWLMKSVALELHVTIGAQQRWHAQRLINLLYVTPAPSATLLRGEGYGSSRSGRMIEGDEWARATDRRNIDGSRFGETTFDLPLTKIMEILNTLNFDESYRTGYGQVSTSLFPHINFEDFRSAGGALYDLSAVHHHMTAELRSSMEKTQERTAEIKRILNALLAINQDQEVGSARWQCAEAWGQIVQITLMRCFSLIPGESREGIIFDILSTLLHKMNSGRTSPMIAESMSLVVLELLEKMQKDRLFQSLLQTSNLQAEPSTIRLPTDTLLHAVLHGILKGIMMAGTSIEMRGNLYIALVRFLQYTKPDELEILQSSNVSPQQQDGSAAAASDASTPSSVPDAPSSVIPSRARLLQNIYAVISNEGEKLFETICRDAADGSGVWNIVAFVVLDAICELASHNRVGRRETTGSKVSGWVLEVMVNRNFLGQFVRAINREDDLALRGIDRRAAAASRFLATEVGVNDESASPGRAGSLNAHLLFELKMAFLLRLSFQYDGAQKLLEYGIVEALADCKFLDQRPESDGNFYTIGYDEIASTPADEQYHNVLVPTLQLILSVARQTQREYNAPARVAAFVAAHQHLLVTILRDSPRVITLASLKQVELVTGLFAYLADWKQPEGHGNGGGLSIVQEKLPEAGHATFHDLLLALLNKYMAARSWLNKLTPASRVEEEKDRVMVAFLGRPSTTSRFKQEGERVAMNVCRNLLSYCVAASDGAAAGAHVGQGQGDRQSTALSVLPLFRLTFADDKDTTRGSKSSSVVTLTATTPTIGSLCQFTTHVIDQLAQSADDHKNVRLKIADIHRLSLDEIQLIIENDIAHLDDDYDPTSTATSYGDVGDDSADYTTGNSASSAAAAAAAGGNLLSAAQKRQLALVALHFKRNEEIRLMNSLLYLIEHLLLLLWRHLLMLQQVSELSAPAVPFVGTTSTHQQQAKKNAAAVVGSLLNKLQAVEYESSTGGPTAGMTTPSDGSAAAGAAQDPRKPFLNMLVRQIGEVLQNV
ncbi:hypothetical protein DFJ77DRAFT_473341 [Powellomyces hirtus]|nr:hypothetical protein DFJ77DRAFT_473341 [Powellomyces hirtus]